MKSLKEVDVGNWVRLFRCQSCETHWKIDEWDKYAARFAVKIEDINTWKDFDSTPLVKELMFSEYGGTTDEKCICFGCTQKRLKGIVYCIDHLYETGART